MLTRETRFPFLFFLILSLLSLPSTCATDSLFCVLVAHETQYACPKNLRLLRISDFMS